MFYVGQQVVCVNIKQNPGHVWHPDADIPNIDEVYTVAALFKHGGFNGIILVEIKNSILNGGYRASRFRPAVNTKTSTHFTEGAPKDSDHWDNRKIKIDA